MAMLCNECRVEGKNKRIMCNHTEDMCMFIRYCSVSGKYYQTDRAKDCKLKGADNGKAK